MPRGIKKVKIINNGEVIAEMTHQEIENAIIPETEETEPIEEIKVEDVPTEVISEVIEPVSNIRVCTCGRTVILPIVGEEPTLCECGVKHTY